LAYPLSRRQVLELLAERGIDVSHRPILTWVQVFGPLLAAAARRHHPFGTWWFVDEVFRFRRGRTRYLYRVIDEHGAVVDVLLRERRDTASAATGLRRAVERPGVLPEVVVTDRHRPYGRAVAATCPGARPIRTGLHRAAGFTTQSGERSHVPTRDHLRNSRGRTQTATGQRWLEGFEALRHLRRAGRPGAGQRVPGPAPHRRVREVAAVLALGATLRRAG
jgi:putative transposase